ncbi:MAG: hypothetical protein ACYCYF_10865, partial [Anaerolineae bacterium]
GMQFLLDAVKYLKPGGVAVHTVEYNVSSNLDTLAEGPVVLFRRQDLRRLVRALRRRGYKVRPTYRGGRLAGDRYVDMPPYKQEVHLKLSLGGYTASSFGLIIENPAAA